MDKNSNNKNNKQHNTNSRITADYWTQNEANTWNTHGDPCPSSPVQGEVVSVSRSSMWRDPWWGGDGGGGGGWGSEQIVVVGVHWSLSQSLLHSLHPLLHSQWDPCPCPGATLSTHLHPTANPSCPEKKESTWRVSRVPRRVTLESESAWTNWEWEWRRWRAGKVSVIGGWSLGGAFRLCCEGVRQVTDEDVDCFIVFYFYFLLL